MKLPSHHGGTPDPESNSGLAPEMPVGYTRPTPLQDLIASMVREAVIQEKGEEMETLEESDDFEDVNPDVLDMSPYTIPEATEEFPIEPDPEPPQSPPAEPEATGDTIAQEPLPTPSSD